MFTARRIQNKKRDVPTSIRLTQEQMAALTELATQVNVSRANIIEYAIERLFDDLLPCENTELILDEDYDGQRCLRVVEKPKPKRKRKK